VNAFRLRRGGRIDRARPLGFSFDGVEYGGFAGDTLASALLANGVRLVGRSFKLHRPRGVLSAGAEEANALVTLGEGALREPNVKATQVDLFDGLVASSQNAWPSLRHDVGALAGLAARFIPAGFYYKTFMWPSWARFETAIRHAAGLGVAPATADPSRYETRYAHCDILVVGAGPAGLAAAGEAAGAGARVLLVDEQSEPGGGLLSEPAASAQRVALTDGIRGNCMVRTTAVACYDHNTVMLIERLTDHLARPAHDEYARQCLWLVRAKAVILATGAFERPVLFADNDRPGIMLANAVRTYIERFAVLPGRNAVVVADDGSAMATVRSLIDAGATISAVVDRGACLPQQNIAELAALGIDRVAGSRIVRTDGRRQVASVTLQDRTGRRRRIACDLVAMAGGWTPNVHLFAQSGGGLRYDAAQHALLPDRPGQACFAAGAARGVSDTAACIADGRARARAALAGIGLASAVVQDRKPDPPAASTRPSGLPDAAAWRRSWVDFQNDVTVADIALAARENYRSVEHLKRYTTLGMAVDQGKTSNFNGLSVLAEMTGRDIAAVGTTQFRPPYTPVPLGAFAGSEVGEHFHPRRLLPTHDWQAAHGAVLEAYGGWERPACYRRQPDETERQSVQREMLAVRQRVGLFDASPLGKIEVAGPDAAVFLDRIYANTISTLPIGRMRYGLMLNELGVIIDDGVVARRAADRFLVGTSSGGAERIAGWLEEWLQCEWPELAVVMASVTTAWATVTVSGPRARDMVGGWVTEIDLSAHAFPPMGFREGTLLGVPVRVARVSFTGELSFEISVPADRGAALWERLIADGATFGIEPVGVEAWLALRIEKGFIHVGADTDGTTVPDDIGFGRAVRAKQGDFVGRRSLTLPGNVGPGRLQLVGVTPVDARGGLVVGAHLCGANDAGKAASASQGYITSACHSPTLGRDVGLALLANGRSRLGELLQADDTAGRVDVRIVESCFYDPKGLRLHG
jgi:sarcosine oxidase subunit alpha